MVLMTRSPVCAHLKKVDLMSIQRMLSSVALAKLTDWNEMSYVIFIHLESLNISFSKRPAETLCLVQELDASY